MTPSVDPIALKAIFSSPRVDGAFEGGFGDYTRDLGRRRPVVLFAFAPKSAGTFFRSAAIEACDGQLVRVAHAQGGRDGTPYMPTFMLYFLGGLCDRTLVTHIHMQALPANRHFMDAFDLRPVIMLRSIPDMLASYIDMLEKDADARADGLNCQIPANFLSMTARDKTDFMIDVMGPWYASYFATWMSYASETPGRVCVLTYDDFCQDPVASLESALAHAGVPCSRVRCEAAFASVWNERSIFRYNHGKSGRGTSYFSTGQIARLARMLSYYEQLGPWREQLLGSPPEALRLAG